MQDETFDTADEMLGAADFGVPEYELEDDGYVDDYTLDRIGLPVRRELRDDR